MKISVFLREKLGPEPSSKVFFTGLGSFRLDPQSSGSARTRKKWARSTSKCFVPMCLHFFLHRCLIFFFSTSHLFHFRCLVFFSLHFFSSSLLFFPLTAKNRNSKEKKTDRYLMRKVTNEFNVTAVI